MLEVLPCTAGMFPVASAAPLCSESTAAAETAAGPAGGLTSFSVDFVQGLGTGGESRHMLRMIGQAIEGLGSAWVLAGDWNFASEDLAATG